MNCGTQVFISVCYSLAQCHIIPMWNVMVYGMRVFGSLMPCIHFRNIAVVLCSFRSLAFSVFASILSLPTLVRYKLLLLAAATSRCHCRCLCLCLSLSIRLRLRLLLLLLLFFVVNCTRMISVVFVIASSTFYVTFVKLINFPTLSHSLAHVPFPAHYEFIKLEM